MPGLEPVLHPGTLLLLSLTMGIGRPKEVFRYGAGVL